MSEMWKPQPVDTLRRWVDAIMEEASDRLTDWENKFIADMDRRLTMGGQLTQTQQEKLEELYAEYTD